MSAIEDAEIIVLKIQEGSAMLFHDQYGTPFIAPNGNGTDVIKIDSKEFKNWLTGKHWDEQGTALNPNTLAIVIQTLSGIARFDGSEKELSVRVSTDGLCIWYDCGDEIVEISKNGWSFIGKPPVKFRRYAHQKKQVFAEEAGGSLNDLIPFVNLTDKDDILLFLVFTVAAFIPGFPHPLLLLYGPQGAGKSTPMRIIKELADPSVIQGTSAPNDAGQFAQLANHHSVLMFDNLSGMKTWLSDALARAATGDGFSKRTLYTDDDDFVFRIQKVIMLNGINQVVTKADLLDRSILLAVKRIENSARIPEKVFWDEFDSQKPKILGAIFTVLSKAVNTYPDVELDELPRMADFAKWGYAIAEAAGYKGEDFIRAYAANVEKQNDEAIEASPVAQAILAFMENKKTWSDSTTVLLQQLNRSAMLTDLKSSPYWPKDAQWLSRRLNEVEPNLQTRGIYFTRHQTDLQRIITLTNENVVDKDKELDE